MRETVAENLVDHRLIHIPKSDLKVRERTHEAEGR